MGGGGGGMFVDLISQEVLDRSVVKVLVDDSSKQVIFY